MRNIANILSAVFHPLLVLTYGVVLAFTFTYLAIYPLRIKLLVLSAVFSLTAFLPGLLIYLMVRYGNEADYALTNRKFRTLPYLLYITSIVSCAFFMLKMMLPFWLVVIVFGAAFVMLVTMCINFFWKISAHMIGLGGLLGGIMGVAKIYALNPWIGFIVAFLIAGLLGTSRLVLKRHTPAQVYAGFALGFISIYISSLLSYFYFFI